MQGYWALPEQTAKAFSRMPTALWYRTGDIVTESDDRCYTYLGRRDRMVKRRGYRVELGEIEAGLYRHDNVKEAAVLAFTDEQAGVSIAAFLSSREAKRPSLIEIKRFCAENLPLYMIPDQFIWFDSSAQDVDRQDRLSAPQGDAVMDFNFTSEQKLLRDSIVKFARGELNHDVIERDRSQLFSRELWRKCAAVGLLGLPVPEAYGGASADPLSCAIALEALGYGCRDGGLVFSICAHVLACVGARLAAWQRSAEGPLPGRSVRRHPGRRARDHGTRFGFGHLRHAPASRAQRRRLAPQRQQDLHLQRSRWPMSSSSSRSPTRRRVSTAG
jgi:hypothetical protein